MYCPDCGEDIDDCECEEEEEGTAGFDADELGLDPEDDVEFLRRKRG